MSAEFLITAFVVVLAPGTGVIYTVATGLGRGRVASFWAAFGCTLGIVPHIAAALAGVAALLHTSAVWFQIFKWAGVAYLVYLAIQTLRDTGSVQFSAKPAQRSVWQTMRTGFLINILNPKLSIFFLAFLPQFVDSAGPALFQMLMLSIIFMAMTFVVFVGYGVFSAFARGAILANDNALKWIRRGTAAAFGAMGVRLALSEA